MVGIALLLSYLLGSLSGSLLVGRLHGVDIRTQGSGNAGGTNAFRTRGWKFALAVVAIDIGKGALAAWLGLAVVGTLDAALACAFAATIGHTWPLFFGFRGGKGAATLVGGLIVAWPASVPTLFAMWLIVLTTTGYVGVSTMLAAITLVPLAWVSGARDFGDPRLPFALAAAAFIVFTHRGNITRVLDGTEHRFDRARVLWRARRRKHGE